MTAREALDVVTSLLETHGQGGPCSDAPDSKPFTYHNSFLIVDPTEAWVLETAGKLWAAQSIKSGFRNISNCLSIGTNIDLKSDGLEEHAKISGFWSEEQGPLDFAKAYMNGGDVSRLNAGNKLLQQLSNSNRFCVSDMFTVLRDEKSGICRGMDECFPSTGSQVSVLSPPLDSKRPCCHWFTGTPDPRLSVFKPFLFSPKARISPHIQSPVYPVDEDPAKVQPRFQKKVDRRHNLYNHHEKAMQDPKRASELQVFLRSLEERCVKDMEGFLDGFNSESVAECDDLFKDIVESELKFYK